MEEFMAHFQEYLILGLILALFFKESLTEFINSKLGLTTKQQVPEWAKNLQLYFNHDTTDHHRATHAKLDQLLYMEEEEHRFADESRDVLRNMDSSLKEIKEYGVKIRR